MTNLNVVGGPRCISETMSGGPNAVTSSKLWNVQDPVSVEELVRCSKPDRRGIPGKEAPTGCVLFSGLQLTQARFNELFQSNVHNRPGGRGR